LWDLDRSYAIAEDAAVTAIAAASGTAWALFDGERIELVGGYEVEPEGVLSPPDGQCLAALSGGELIVGRSGARLARTRPGPGSALEPLEAFDAVLGRDGWENPAGATPDLRSLAVGDDGRIYANVHVGGVWASDDGGSSWVALIEPQADVHQVVTGVGGTLAVAAARGFGWSGDRGTTWQWSTAGLHAPYCRAVALDGEAAYVTASTGPGSTESALYRAPRSGEPFTKCAGGLPEWFPSNIDTAQLAARDGRVAFGTDGGEVWQSVDGGNRFERISFRIGRVTAVAFV
jgi:hypothetical protein